MISVDSYELDNILENITLGMAILLVKRTLSNLQLLTFKHHNVNASFVYTCICYYNQGSLNTSHAKCGFNLTYLIGVFKFRSVRLICFSYFNFYSTSTRKWGFTAMVEANLTRDKFELVVVLLK